MDRCAQVTEIFNKFTSYIQGKFRVSKPYTRVRQRYTIFKSVMLAAPEDFMPGAVTFYLTNAVTVAMEQWSLKHCAIIVEMCFFLMVTLLLTRRMFIRGFNVAGHGKVPGRNTIQL